MDTARYRAFIMAAETGSIRNAADALGYTSSGVSQLIRSLETDLGITLLLRGKRGVTLTPSGELALPIARKIVSQENYLFQLASDINGTVLGTVNVATYHSLALAWMPDIIEAFQKRYPEVRVNLYEGTQTDIGDRLTSGKADIALFNDWAMTEKHDWIPLCDDPMLAVVPASHPMADAEVFPVREFAHERFIMPEHGFDYDVMDILDKYEITPDVYLSTFDSFILLEMVSKGLGVSIVNESCLHGSPVLDRIRTIPLDTPHSLKMGIAVMSMDELTPAVRKFADVAIQTIAPDRNKGVR